MKQLITKLIRESCKTYHPGKKEDTPQRDGGPGPSPIRETNVHTKSVSSTPHHTHGFAKIFKNQSRVLIQWFEITAVTRVPSIAVDKNRKIYQRKNHHPRLQTKVGT